MWSPVAGDVVALDLKMFLTAISNRHTERGGPFQKGFPLARMHTRAAHAASPRCARRSS